MNGRPALAIALLLCGLALAGAGALGLIGAQALHGDLLGGRRLGVLLGVISAALIAAHLRVHDRAALRLESRAFAVAGATISVPAVLWLLDPSPLDDLRAALAWATLICAGMFWVLGASSRYARWTLAACALAGVGAMLHQDAFPFDPSWSLAAVPAALSAVCVAAFAHASRTQRSAPQQRACLQGAALNFALCLPAAPMSTLGDWSHAGLLAAALSVSVALWALAPGLATVVPAAVWALSLVALGAGQGSLTDLLGAGGPALPAPLVAVTASGAALVAAALGLLRRAARKVDPLLASAYPDLGGPRRSTFTIDREPLDLLVDPPEDQDDRP